MKKSYVIVEHRRSDVELRLADRVKELESQVKSLNKELDRTAVLYGREVYINSQLIDLLKLHDIKFKPYLDTQNK